MDSQRLLVISDTHGNISALETVLKWARNQPINAAVFLGDGVHDLPRAATVAGFYPEWKQVRGNNDYAPSVPEAAVYDFCGHRFFLCHGHRYGLYNGYNTLIAAARNTEAEAALFGHLHIPILESTGDRTGGLLLVNPGSIGRPRGNVGATFALIDCPPEKPLSVQFWKLGPHGKIVELKM